MGSKMKARSNGQQMQRRQERLWKQRRLTLTQRLRDDLKNERDEQFRTRTSKSNNVALWWSYGAEDEGTPQDSMFWRSNCDHCEAKARNEQRDGMTLTMDESGCHCESMTNSFKPTESWKTLRVEKACNRTILLTEDRMAVNGDRSDWDAGSAIQARHEGEWASNDVEVTTDVEGETSWNVFNSAKQLLG
ncbi:hypothetical protein DVH05_024874 [Phytophthora capsici]|nr:hypothetical protein DVH05_024874 [Phytophthora capsici]